MDIINQIVSILDKTLPFIIGVLLIGLISSAVSYMLFKIMTFYRYKNETRHYFEIIPPASAAIEAEATTELFKVIHGIGRTRSIINRLVGYRPRISLEIVATKHKGIRYIIGAPVSIARIVQQEVRSYIVDALITPTEDPYLSILSSYRSQPMEFRLRRHFALPLTPKNRLENHDPLAYLTGNMTALKENEMIIYQLVIIPRVIPKAKSIAGQVLTNEDVLSNLMDSHSNPLSSVFSFINSVIFSLLDSIGGITSRSTNSFHTVDPMAMHSRQVAMHLKPSRVLSTFEQEAVESIHSKLSEPLFQTSVRTIVVSPSKTEVRDRSRSLRTSLTTFSTTQYQSIISRFNLFNFIHNPFRLTLQRYRLPSFLLRSSLILSTSEISDLFHFPYAGTNKTENIVKSLSRTLPAPLSLKNNPTLDVLVGENIYHGVTTSIGLTNKERERHMYVIGGTGNGKTTMLQYMIIQDIKNGKGVAVIDPHGDMAQEILMNIPDERIKDVVYFNPDDLAYPIGLNLLELDKSLTGDDLLREKDLITESVISIFRKIFSSDDSGGHRIEYILRNAIQTSLTVPDCTIFTIYRLLNDVDYRKVVIKNLEDEDLNNFWNNELGKAGDMQKVKMVAGITAKVGRFLFSASAKRILEQPKSTICFEDIIDTGKILICNFSKGLIGEDTSELLGIAVLAKLQLASLRRARQIQAERRPYYLYVDEFQNFATISFVQMLSESRKYKLFLTMAEQSTSQQADKDMVNIILANVGTVVCFRTGNPVDEKIMLPLFYPYIDQGELMSLPSYNFYMRLAAIHSQEPLSGVTVVSPSGTGNINQITDKSRRQYAKKYIVQIKCTKEKDNKIINKKIINKGYTVPKPRKRQERQ